MQGMYKILHSGIVSNIMPVAVHTHNFMHTESITLVMNIISNEIIHMGGKICLHSLPWKCHLALLAGDVHAPYFLLESADYKQVKSLLSKPVSFIHFLTSYQWTRQER